MKGPKPIDQALKDNLDRLAKIKGLMIKGRKLQIAIRLEPDQVEKIMDLDGDTFREKIKGLISDSLAREIAMLEDIFDD